MLGGIRAADIAGIEQLRHKRPGIFNDLFPLPGGQRNGGIKPPADTPQPALLFPSAKKSGGIRAADTERRCGVVDRDELAALAENQGKPLSIFFGQG